LHIAIFCVLKDIAQRRLKTAQHHASVNFACQENPTDAGKH